MFFSQLFITFFIQPKMKPLIFSNRLCGRTDYQLPFQHPLN